MALTTGPLFSFDASGKLGGSIVYSKWKGRNYVRQLVIPANPKSPKQLSVRAMMKFLSQEWAGLPQVDQDSWLTIAAELSISSFNAYIRDDLRRWRSFEAPGQRTPILEVGTLPSGSSGVSAGGILLATVTTDLTVENDGWGIMIFRSLTTGFATGFDNLVAINKHDSTVDQIFVDTPLAAGTFFYNYRPFTDDGVLGAELGETSAVVTSS